MRCLTLLLALALWTAYAHGQSCPQGDGSDSAEASTLNGTVVDHDELRHWVGFKLDRPVCEVNELELVFSDAGGQRRGETLRECRATVTGKLYYGLTGYYSLPMAISVEKLEPDSSCRPARIRPDPSLVRIPSDLQVFNATITIDYRGKGHTDVKVWKSRTQSSPLQPWESYVDFQLTGSSDVARFNCANGFRLTQIIQTPAKTQPTIPEDPDWAGTVLQNEFNRIQIICKRRSQNVKSKPEPSKNPSK